MASNISDEKSDNITGNPFKWPFLVFFTSTFKIFSLSFENLYCVSVWVFWIFLDVCIHVFHQIWVFLAVFTHILPLPLSLLCPTSGPLRVWCIGLFYLSFISLRLYLLLFNFFSVCSSYLMIPLFLSSSMCSLLLSQCAFQCKVSGVAGAVPRALVDWN